MPSMSDDPPVASLTRRPTHTPRRTRRRQSPFWRRQLLLGLVVVVLLIAAFFIGRETAPSPDANASRGAASTGLTTITASGPTVAKCAKAVAAVYQGAGSSGPQFLAGTSSAGKPIAYGCENQEMLATAMQSVAGPINASSSKPIPNSDVLNVVREVCNNWPNGPLCTNG
jgi:hypothetical protein